MVLVLTTRDNESLYEINKVGVWSDIPLNPERFADQESYTAFVYFTGRGIGRKLKVTLWENRIIYKILEGTNNPIPIGKLIDKSIFSPGTRLEGPRFYRTDDQGQRLMELWAENNQAG